MLIRLCEASRGASVCWLQHPSLLGRNAGQANSVPSAKLIGLLAGCRRVRGPLEKSPRRVPVSSRACGVWVLSLTFGTRLGALGSHDRYMIFD